MILSHKEIEEIAAAVTKDFNDSTLLVEVRNRKLRAEVTPLPFYKRNK